MCFLIFCFSKPFISAIELKASRGLALIKADGSAQALSAQSLTGELLGVAYNVQARAAGIVQTTEQASAAGSAGG